MKISKINYISISKLLIDFMKLHIENKMHFLYSFHGFILNFDFVMIILSILAYILIVYEDV